MRAEVEDREDVRVRERGDGLGLALEARERVGVRGQLRGKDLDRDVAVELRVARAVDLAHAPGAERREDLVGAEACSGGKRQVGCILGENTVIPRSGATRDPVRKRDGGNPVRDPSLRSG